MGHRLFEINNKGELMQTSKKLFVRCLSILLIFNSLNIVAQDNEESVEEVVVTGSYIKGSPTDGASPVEIISRDTIDALSASTVADITANIAINSGAENNVDSFTSGSTQGSTNVNLRGLGLTSTLVLLDGKRHTTAGITANDGSVYVNTSIIPVNAIERVEVLKEGAASIYGSDAVAGVVNYIFRRDFTGLEVDVSTQETDLGGQTDDKMSIILGTELGNGNLVFALSSLDRSPLSGSAFDPSLALVGISGFGTSFLAFGAGTVDSGPYAGSYSAFENIPDPNCIANKGIIFPQASGSRCGFFYGDRFNVVNDEDHLNTYTSYKMDLENGRTFKFDYLTSKIDVNDNFQSPSYPALSLATPANVILPGQGGSPFAFPVMFLGRALGSAFASPPAPRSLEAERLSLGISGEMANGFDMDLNYTYSAEQNEGKQPDTSTSRFLNAIRGGTGSPGTWNLFDSTSNSQELINYISTAQETFVDVELHVLDFVMTGTVNDLEVATGFQMRKEHHDVARNDDSIAGFDANGNLAVPADLIFLGGGIETSASRSAYAIFAEAAKQASERVELRGAIRYEKLESDSSINPKVSIRMQANDNLVLRGSLSTSFREPSLSQLNQSSVGLQGIQDFDAAGNAVGQPSFIRIAQAYSSDLIPEESTNMNIGAIWTPNDQFSAKFDYWSIDYTDVITIESAQGKVIADPSGPDVVRLVDGTLIGVTTRYKNASEIDTDGYDIEASYNFESRLGDVTLGINRAHMLSYEIPAAGGGSKDVLGLFNHDNFARSLPETKTVISASLVNGQHSMSAFYRMISDYKTTNVPNAFATSVGLGQDIDEFNVLDLKYSYSFDMDDSNLSLSFGVKNATDEGAPFFYDSANFNYDPRQHDPRGRIVYMGVKYSR